MNEREVLAMLREASKAMVRLGIVSQENLDLAVEDLMIADDSLGGKMRACDLYE